MRINIKWFFKITSILLILFAAGLVAQGVHELQEATIIPTIIEQVWNINPIIDEGSSVAGILRSLFGYNGNPSLIEVLSYFIYLIFVFVLGKNIERVHKMT